MKCLRCQHENRLGAKFCEECASPLTRSCSHCGSPLPGTAKYCPECAHPVSESASAPAGFGSPASYTPKHLAERILLSRDALEGERKQVTVLFADMKGSMDLLADRDPEEARKILDPVLEKMIEAVHRYDGTVNQVMGDGIMALFGAPLTLEDHAVRACYAALAMQLAIRAYGEELRRSRGQTVRIRVGLNSGDVVVRAIRSDLHMDYTAVGQTTHLAARMEQLANPDSTLLTAATLQLVEGLVTVKPQGPVAVRGLSEPVELYELTGAGLARTRLQAAATRGLTRFVGRSAEFAQMFAALQRSQVGHGQVFALVGEPGVGKSRLVWEFIHSHRTQGWLVLESASMSYGKASAYRPVIDLLRSYFHIEDRDDARRIREKATGKLMTLDEALEPHLVPLLALLDVALEDERWKPLDPMQKRMRTLDACKRLLLREAQVQPLLLVFEDLHWIDNETQALLDALVESLPTARLLLLVNFRPEYQSRWTSKTYYSQFRIDPLTSESAEELLQTLLGTDPSLWPLTRLLIERTEGNPLYLEESVRTLVETGELQGSRGAYRLATALTSILVPATVQAILAARIDRLAPEDKHLLQAAAVIGKDVPCALLQVIVELPEEVLRQRVGALQAREFLYEKSLFPDLEYTFKHALTHEVAYGSVLQERRKALHAQIMASIERLYADRLVEQIERLAHHALRGEVWDKALSYLRQVGEKAIGRSANREASAWFVQALEALTHIPQSRQSIEQAIDLRFDLRSALHAQGAFKRILDSLQEAQQLAEGLGDQRRLGRVFGYLALTLAFMGDPGNALAAGHRALDIAESLAELGLQAGANYSLGLINNNLGDYRQAMKFNNRTIDSLQGGLIRERFGLPVFPAVYARHLALLSLAPLGEFDEAIARAEEGFRIAEALNHPLSHLYVDMAAGFLYLYRGQLDEAIRLLEHGLMLCEDTGSHLIFAWVASYLGSAYARSGRLSDGVLLLEKGVETLTSLTVMLRRSYVIGLLGEAYVLAGRMDDACECARRALDLSKAQKERGHEAETRRLLGEIAAHGDAPDVQEAEDSYRQAMAISRDLEMRPLLARCHWGLGKLYLRTGDGPTAREQLRAAIDMFRQMGMQFWLEKAASALKEASTQ